MAKLTSDMIKDFDVPDNSMTMWWLGQAGFVIKSPGGASVVLDPYLSNSCKQVGEELGFNMDRLVPAPITPQELVGVSAYVMTHSHQDHLDPETIGPYRQAGGEGPFVAPPETIEKLRDMGVPDDQLVMVWANKTCAIGDVLLRATFAIPFGGDDLTHVGYLVSIQDGPTAYFSGDTAYHELLAISIREHHPDIMVPVINGAFRNLGPAEAAQLAHQIDPTLVIPCHYDLFPDNVQPPEMLRTNLRILGIADKYQVIEHGVAFTYTRKADGEE